MSILWNNQYSKEQLQSFTSSMSPLAGLRPFVYDDGRIRSMRGIDGWTGSGLRFTLLPDRGLDLGPVWFNDKPVSWVHPGFGTPNQYEPDGSGWLHTFGGGLLTTCGLIHFGSPDNYFGQSHGLHGRVSHIPAENVRIWQEWRDNDYVLIVEGEVRQAVLFGENLLLKRRYETSLGSQQIILRDSVTNEGSRLTPHGLLYHCNIGFPVLSPSSRLIINDEKVTPRTPTAASDLEVHTRFDAPKTGYEEQVFFHYPVVDSSGYAKVALINPDIRYGIQLRWLAESMPVLTQWKMLGQGEYVCGLEPATHAMAPYEDLVKESLPHILEPGETVTYELQLTILENFPE